VHAWDTALLSSTELQQRVPVSHLQYSGDGCYLLVVLAKPPTLRIFKTADWSFQEWVCKSDVRDVAWSSDSRYVLFCTASTLYSVGIETETGSATAQVDLTAVQLRDDDGDTLSVGGSCLALAWGGDRCVVVFHNCPAVLLLHTVTQPHLQILVAGTIKGPDDCLPVSAAFHPSQPSLLTLAWDDHSLQHVPFNYAHRKPDGTVLPLLSYGAARNVLTRPHAMLQATPLSQGRPRPHDSFNDSVFSPVGGGYSSVF